VDRNGKSWGGRVAAALPSRESGGIVRLRILPICDCHHHTAPRRRAISPWNLRFKPLRNTHKGWMKAVELIQPEFFTSIPCPATP
jgi:hypothetical protein